MEAPKNELSPSFEPAAAPPPPEPAPAKAGVTVTLDLDADVLAWLQEQPTDWRQELNNLARFYMETSLIRDEAFKDAASPEHEIQVEGPDPARNASKIDHDFIPS